MEENGVQISLSFPTHPLWSINWGKTIRVQGATSKCSRVNFASRTNTETQGNRHFLASRNKHRSHLENREMHSGTGVLETKHILKHNLDCRRRTVVNQKRSNKGYSRNYFAGLPSAQHLPVRNRVLSKQVAVEQRPAPPDVLPKSRSMLETQSSSDVDLNGVSAGVEAQC